MNTIKWYQALSLGALVAAEAAMLSIIPAPKAKDSIKPAYDKGSIVDSTQSPDAIYQAKLVDMDGNGIHDLFYINGKGQVSIQNGLVWEYLALHQKRAKNMASLVFV